MKKLARALLIWAALITPAMTAGGGQAGLPIYSESVLIETIEQWKTRDGALGGAISDYWCEFVIQSPERFLMIMNGRSHVFADWLGSLADLSFTDHGGCINLECRRRQMIGSLESLSDAKLRPLGKRLLDRLKAIKVRSVD